MSAGRVATLQQQQQQRDRGTATAETAVALPALAVVLALAMWAVGAVNAQLRCVDAARLAARAAARGESPGASIARAREAAPPDAQVTLSRSGELVTVVVRTVRAVVGGWGGGPGVQVEGRATADAEDAVLSDSAPP